MGWWGRHAVTALLVLACVGCDAAGTPAGVPVPAARAEDKGFVLEVRLPSAEFSAATVIPVTATLTWTGAAASQSIWGSGSGPVSFGFEEIGGQNRLMGGAMTADCGVREFARGVPVAIPVQKSGGWTGEDPNAAFYAAWFRDPVLHLPPGHWRLTVGASGYLAPCAMDAPALDLKIAPIDLVIR